MHDLVLEAGEWGSKLAKRAEGEGSAQGGLVDSIASRALSRKPMYGLSCEAICYSLGVWWAGRRHSNGCHCQPGSSARGRTLPPGAAPELNWAPVGAIPCRTPPVQLRGLDASRRSARALASGSFRAGVTSRRWLG